MMCMFRHELDNVDTSETVETVVKEKSDNPIDIIDVEEQEESVNDESIHVEDISNNTFLNPSQTDKVSGSEMFKCEKCNFHSSTKFRFIIHKESYHNWCPKCYSTFRDQDDVRNHTKTTHNKNVKG